MSEVPEKRAYVALDVNVAGKENLDVPEDCSHCNDRNAFLKLGVTKIQLNVPEDRANLELRRHQHASPALNTTEDGGDPAGHLLPGDGGFGLHREIRREFGKSCACRYSIGVGDTSLELLSGYVIVREGGGQTCDDSLAILWHKPGR